MLNLRFWEKCDNVKDLFRGLGDFGEVTGDINRDGQILSNESDDYRVKCVYEKDEYGVFTRQDTFQNLSEEFLTVNCLKSRFVFEGGEYEVYTQFNNWQVESSGSWQVLNTSITAAGDSTRTTQNATPFLALWSNQEQRGVAFHLLPNCAWEMKVSRIGVFEKHTKVLVELGIKSDDFTLKVAPREEVQMPRILCYEFKNRLDMECYRLHQYAHTHYPRKAMPVIYNSWMYRFTDITCERLMEQAELAAELGVEYFAIDAGWFGKGDSWYNSVGDWSENLTGGLFGRMIEVAEKVRACGMKFGLWLEPERAAEGSDAVRDHREYFVKEGYNYFLDYANEEAWRWMLGMICELIDRYGVEYIKFDYNANMYYDIHRNSFMEYQQGHENFIKALRSRYPEIYLTGCASGGVRMELANYTKFDSFWISDNHGLYDQMRIHKDTLLRLPPQAMERWAAIHSLQGFEDFYKPFTGSSAEESVERVIACNDEAWCDITGVHRSYLHGFMTGCPIGLSCDLKAISPIVREDIRRFIADFKENREYWANVVARILADTESVTIYQYSDIELKRIVVQTFSKRAMQESICVYPEVNCNCKYLVNGKDILNGRKIAEEGIEMPIHKWHEMTQIILVQIM